MVIEQVKHPGYCWHVTDSEELVMKTSCTTVWQYTEHQRIVHVRSGKCVYAPAKTWSSVLLSTACNTDESRFQHTENGILSQEGSGLCIHVKGGGLERVENKGFVISSKCGAADWHRISFDLKAGTYCFDERRVFTFIRCLMKGWSSDI